MNSTHDSLRMGSLLALITFLALAPPNDGVVRPMRTSGPAFTASTLRADEPTRRGPLTPEIAPESPQAERAMGGFRVPEGIQVSLFAAEPMMANPVAFCFDERGRVYVCETFRQSRGVTDNRSHDQAWLLADLAAQTVEDRIRYHRELLGAKANEFERHDDRIRLLEDTTGDGRADRSVVFADGFHQLEEGTGAGVLAYRGDLYFTNIPRLWRLRDTTGDGRSDVREALHDGYGVRVAFRGHDLHGLIMGPDGRLYFSIGDRGYHLQLGDRTLADPESGAVFRCLPDGSHLEVFATGLRNPQELAFDEFGNLFTGDNNSDSGDRARWVYVVEGGDSGWRMAYQYLPDRGPFNRERIWHPFHAGQPAYIVPPVANLGDGPSGLAYYPGVGLDDRFLGKFFLCDFRGGPANSGVRTFRVQPQGAFFELMDQEETIWRILATDVAFAPDGSLFVSDWVDGWEGEGKGRLYRFALENATDPRIAEVKSLLASEWDEHPEQRLVDLLSHADQRIRQEAQFELVRRQATATLARVAQEGDHLLARLHAIWGMEQLHRQGQDSVSVRVPALTLLEELLEDTDPEVRSQSARMLGEIGAKESIPVLRGQLDDESTRVRYFAANAMGRVGSSESIPDLLRLLEENADRDPIVRLGGIMGLAGSGDIAALTSAALHPSRSARLGVVVALRKLRSPAVARFLEDADVDIVTEAARAIHDLPLPDAMPALADLLPRAPIDDALLRRVLNANYRLGTSARAELIAQFTDRDGIEDSLRIEAVRMLADWSATDPRDRVLGMSRPLPPRDAGEAKGALTAVFPRLLARSEGVRREALSAATKLGLGEATPFLRSLLDDPVQSPAVRAAALGALATLGDGELGKRVRHALDDAEPIVRNAAREVLATLTPQEALASIAGVLTSDSRVERQGGFSILARIDLPEVDTLLADSLQQLLAGDLPADTELDLLEAAQHRDSIPLRRLLDKFEAQSRDTEDPLAAYSETLWGGNAERGRQIFFERTEVSCVRCHRVTGIGGDVGPELTRIAQEKKREYLLEAIVAPSRTIAKNYESAVVSDVQGRIHTGIVKSEDAAKLELMTADGTVVTLAQDDIEDRTVGQSAMPADVVKLLSKRDIRDLVEWLSQLR